jgi:hypothetical protein
MAIPKDNLAIPKDNMAKPKDNITNLFIKHLFLKNF